MSQSALSEVLRAVKAADSLPAGHSRHSLKRARQNKAGVETPYGQICRTWTVEKEDGSVMQVHYQDPAAMLWHLVDQSPSLATFLQQRLNEHPCSGVNPWGLIFYADEVTPGNALKANNKRRMQAIYWSLAELGSDALCHERCWMLLAAVRTKTVQQLKDGMSQISKQALLSFARPGGNFGTGIQLRTGGGSCILLATMRTIIADESALKHTFNNKGASGKVPCVLRRNVIRKYYAPDPLTPPLVLHTCLDETKFLQHTTQSLAELARYLDAESRNLNKGAMNDLQVRLGFNHSPQGVLASREIVDNIDIAGAVCFDWMHIYLVAGLFHNELTLLTQQLHKVGVKGEELHACMQDFQWPTYLGSKAAGAKNIFESKKKPEDDVKSSASEALSAYPVIRVFINDLLRERPGIPKEVKNCLMCFIMLCTVLDYLLLASRQNGDEYVNGLRSAIIAHLSAFKNLYGEDLMPPKSHYALHLPQMLDRFGSLASCFVHERRHKELKRFANNQCNSAEGTERHLMEEMLLSHLEELKTSEPVIHPALVGPKPASKEVQQHFKAMGGVDSCNDLLASSKAYYAPNRWAATGDVVLMRRPPGVGEVVYHCKFEEYLLTCVSPYSKHSSKDNCFTINRSEHTLIFSSDIANTCIFKESGGLCFVAPQLSGV